ncbi:MAG TPA: SCO family protein [Gaiellaceae bacterium]|nr:SCO family protein [Gaiellaceae bacterium]
MRYVARLAVVLVASALALAGCGSAKKPKPPQFAGAVLENPAPPPDFTLRDQQFRPVHLRALRGKVVLVTFLYTHCPDVCPITAANLNTALQRLGGKRSRVRVLAVSVDPAGDTHASVLSFIRRHRLLSQFRYLTGGRATLAQVWRRYSVVSVRRGAGDVDHTLYTLLLDRSGTARVLFDVKATPAAIVHDVRLLLA